MKKYLQLPVVVRWSIALGFILALGILLFWWVALVNESFVWSLLFPILVPVIQFLVTPLLMLIGFYKYFSPMVVSMRPTRTVIDLHNGTSFDYLFEMQGVKPGLPWKKTMMRHYLTALQTIIHKIELDKLPESVTIRGSSYFLSERSAKKLGFSIRKTGLAEKLNIYANYVDLIWMYSLANGALTWPDLTNVSTVRISGTELVRNKQKITHLLNGVTH